jgi:hypothetical protein
MAIWYILLPIGKFYGDFVVLGYIFPRFGILYPGKSGNPVSTHINKDATRQFGVNQVCENGLALNDVDLKLEILLCFIKTSFFVT